jgi:hypothetical protein
MSKSLVLHLKYNPWSSGIARKCKVCSHRSGLTDKIHVWTDNPDTYNFIEYKIDKTKEGLEEIIRCNDPYSSIVLIHDD